MHLECHPYIGKVKDTEVLIVEVAQDREWKLGSFCWSDGKLTSKLLAYVGDGDSEVLVVILGAICVGDGA